MSDDSLKKKYLFKLSTNLIGFFINIATAGIVPRALGVNNYGNFNFISTILKQILSFLDFKTSVCFFTKLSQRQKEKNLIIFYTYYTLVILTLLIVVVTVISLTPLRQYVFAEIEVPVIYYALIYVILYWILDIFIKTLDATGQTVQLERRRIFNKIVSTLLVLILYFYDTLNLTVYFYYLYVTILLLIISLFLVLHKNIGSDIKIYPFLKKKINIAYINEFYIYSKPLAFFVFFGLVNISFDRWMLQIYGGSFQQGLYSFAFTLSNFSFLFITAIIPLFTRELSIASKENDTNKMAKVFRQYVPFLYALTAFFCSFMFVERESVIALFGGVEYIDAESTIGVMAFYPLVLTYSNLNGSVIYANGKTKIFFLQSLFFLPLGMLLTYIFLSNGIFGLELGALGLAYKNLIIEFLSINVILFVNSRFLKINYLKYLLHMIGSVIPFIIFAYLSQYLISLLVHSIDLSSELLISFLLSGFLYSVFTIIIILFCFPIIFGLQRHDVISFTKNIFFKKTI
jgi:O-antigen/teichoic acid export membrane protein